MTDTLAAILIVDDNIDNLRFLSALLSDQGYGVRKALSGKLALGSVQREPPDLILLDVNMPELDGYEVCRQLKTNPTTHHIPVIFLTAYSGPEVEQKTRQAGGSGYLAKPINVEEILRCIQDILRSDQSGSHPRARH